VGDVTLKPQPGPQEAFLSSPADIAIYGGAAGGGKTYALLLEPLRHAGRRGFGAVAFRRKHNQITNEGGLWDEAGKMYPATRAAPFKSPQLGYRWKRGGKITFAHLNQELDVHSWQGSQIALMLFDELTHFEESQFWYMLSRSRSTCGISPYVRATTNPDSDSWVRKLIAWWIGEDGFPIPERAGVVRWFVRVDGKIHWGDSREVALDHGMDVTDAKSLTFIPASVSDNKELLRINPSYLANLRALGRVERGRLLGGNWNIRPAAGMYFRRNEAKIVRSAEPGTRWCRGWDLAASEVSEQYPDPDWTQGALLGMQPSGRLVVGHIRSARERAAKIKDLVRSVAGADERGTIIALPQDPGQAGKGQADDLILHLGGFDVRAWKITGDKVTLAGPFSAQWERGNVDVVEGPWNDALFDELEAFPTPKVHDDRVDALSLAYYALTHDFTPTAATSANINL
jgi:predicted phage terminase large subunit-like protein